MEFKPRAPREGINVSKTHPLNEFTTLIVGLVAVLLTIVVLATWSVDLAIRFISPETEAKLFDASTFEPLLQEALESVDERRDDVQRVLDKVAAHWPDSAYEFQVAILPDSDANAAALPGGYILVTTALLDDVESENELAFVLGHELGHFHNRDHLRRLGRGVVYGLAMTVVFGGSGTVPDVANLIGDLTSKGFDRGQERDADRFGLELVEAEYGHIGSSWQFFKRLADESPKLDHVIAYLSTHPASAERIDELREFAVEQEWALNGPIEPFTVSEEED